MPSPRRAFSLLELLVTVTVISLLTSALLPALGQARRAARATQCASQLRQIGLGWTLYAQQHEDVAIAARPAKMPGDNLYFVGNGFKVRPRWHVALGAAVGIYAYEPRPDESHQVLENRLLVCPEVADWTSERNSAYGYNFQFLGNARYRTPGVFIRYPVPLQHIRAAQTVVAADSLGTAAHFAAAERAPNRADGAGVVRAAGNHGYMLDPPRLTEAGDFCDDSNRGIRGGPDPRHTGRVNFAFADAHVERLTPEQAGYARRPDGSFRLDGAETHNRLFSGTGQDADPPPARP